MNSKSIAGLIALSLGLTGGLVAQTKSNTESYSDRPSVGALKHADKNFVEEAAKGGLEEVAISRIALTKTTNPQVKEFAQMMVDDHSAAGTKLAAIAATKGVMLPKEPGTDRWMKKDAKGFDEDYMEKMVDDHQEAVKRFEKQAKNGTDPDLTAFARETLPKLQEHLAHAKRLHKAVDR